MSLSLINNNIQNGKTVADPGLNVFFLGGGGEVQRLEEEAFAYLDPPL